MELFSKKSLQVFLFVCFPQIPKLEEVKKKITWSLNTSTITKTWQRKCIKGSFVMRFLLFDIITLRRKAASTYTKIRPLRCLNATSGSYLDISAPHNSLPQRQVLSPQGSFTLFSFPKHSSSNTY